MSSTIVVTFDGQTFHPDRPLDLVPNQRYRITLIEDDVAADREPEPLIRKAAPEDWAASQHKLARTFRDSSYGDRTDNLERAIAAYEKALTVYTQEAFPENWVAIQHKLAIANHERADNLEENEETDSEIDCNPKTDSVWDWLEENVGSIEAPEDWSIQHDHYLYGIPKRKFTEE